jgi:hypothetical protein
MEKITFKLNNQELMISKSRIYEVKELNDLRISLNILKGIRLQLRKNAFFYNNRTSIENLFSTTFLPKVET